MSNRMDCGCTGCINSDGTCRVDPLERLAEMRRRLTPALPRPPEDAPTPPKPRTEVDDEQRNEERER